MTATVNTQLIKEIKKYGAFDISACYDCGNCTAVCPLSKNNEFFPRKLIRYGRLGLKDDMISLRELWLCYYCGECSDTCPKQAYPGEFMAATRRFAIANYDPTGLSAFLFKKPLMSILFSIVLAILLAVFMLNASAKKGLLVMGEDSVKFFEYLSAPFIHHLGMAIFIFIGFAGLVGIIRMMIMLTKFQKLLSTKNNQSLGLFAIIKKGISAIMIEIIGQRRYIVCDEDKDTLIWFRKPWFIHAMMFWGFMILWTVTGMHWMMDEARYFSWMPIFLQKTIGTPLSLLHPLRFFGTIGGLMLFYGTTYTVIKRLFKSDAATIKTHVSDWLFLGTLWLVGFTGFLLEIALYLPNPARWSYYMLVIHVAISMELLLLWPFTKFAHVFYRSVAVFISAINAPE